MHTIVHLIEESCRKFADKTALRHKIGGIWQEVSYGTLWADSGRIAAGLVKNGFTPGEHAALLASSSPRWVMAYTGILRGGGIVVPIDRELKRAELLQILTDSEARVLITERPYLDTVLGMVEELPSLRQIVTLDASPPQGMVLSLGELLQEGRFSFVPRRHDDTALILYTSGTTGRSKGAMLSHANLVSNIRGASARFKVDETVHTLSFLPINHVFEQVCGILVPLSAGGKVSFCESLKKLGENLTEVKPTFFIGVPAVYRKILDRMSRKIGERALSRLLFSFSITRPLVRARIRRTLGTGTTFVSGGAALDPDVAFGLARLGVTIFQGYGITETSPIISAECPAGARLGTTGRVLEGIEVRIDRPNEEGVGEILVRGPNVMQGYYRNPQATAEVLVDGWYRTGDLGRLDKDGFLSVCGRVKNLIVTSNGRNVYPEEVENELLKSPFIAEAIVYGHKVDPVTEEIHAMVYPDREALDDQGRNRGSGSFSGEEVESLLRVEVMHACERLAAYKRVKKVIVREDEFPKTTTRKIKRHEIHTGCG